MSLVINMLRSSSMLAIAMITGRGAVVLCGILIARYFGAEAFALFTFVHLTATSVSNIAMLGLMKGLTRYIARMQVDPSVAALSRAMLALGVIALGLALAILVMALLPVSLIGLPDPDAKAVLLALILTIGLNNLLIGANNGFEAFTRITLGTFAMGLVLMVGVGVAVWMDAPQVPLLGYLAATIVSAAVLLALPLRAFRQCLAEQTPRLDGDSFRAVGGYIGPMFVATIMTNTGLWLAGRSLLSGEAGTQAFAEFSVGLQWFGLAQMSSNVVSRVVLPLLTRNAYANDLAAQKAASVTGIIIAGAGALIVLLVVALFHPSILPLYGEELSDAKWPLFVMVMAGVVAAPVSVLGNLLVARERYRDYLVSTGIWWAIIVIGIVLLPVGDAANISGLVLVSYVVFLAASFWFVFLDLRRMK